jgi:hypothetical protein
MKKRNRDAEVDVSLEYLRALRDGYEHMLYEAEIGLMPWGHAVKVTKLIWDPVNDMPDWDRVAETVRRSYSNGQQVTDAT